MMSLKATLTNKKLLEIGAGTGLAGICSYHFGEYFLFCQFEPENVTSFIEMKASLPSPVLFVNSLFRLSEEYRNPELLTLYTPGAG